MANKHAVVRTDNMTGTDVRAGLVSVRYMGSAGSAAEDIENGNVVKLDKLIEGEREVYVGKDVKKNDKIDDVVLIASVETMYDERKRNLDEFINEKDGKPQRAYHFHAGDTFAVTKEALAGKGSPAKGDVIELADGTKLNVAVSATAGSTTVGKIIDVETVGRYTYYVIYVSPATAAASEAA